MTSCSLAFAISGVIGVFCVELDPIPASGADATVWTIVGDLPTAYLVHSSGDTWQDAVQAYVEEMERWIAAVREGGSLDDVIPISVSPSPEHAGMLATRLDFLRRNLVNVDPRSLTSDV